ncbi:MAG: hypothetical protein IJE57_04060, partial [Anaerotignum sp.]|nr:hypothetical protein [Anaerotignum sp.]
ETKAEPLTEKNFSSLQTGDHIRIKDLPHSVIVLEVNDTSVTVLEGNLNGAVSWNNVYTKAELLGYSNVTVQSAY